MCGIVGYVGTQAAVDVLLDGISKLEYRGYDSAGLATVSGVPARTQVRRAVGKVSALAEITRGYKPEGRVGIAHTRWATHGAPRVENAHPHHIDGITIVHNGIFDNAAALRSELETQGRRFLSQTDTEVLAHLIAQARADGLGLTAALRLALSRIEGAWAVAILDECAPDRLAFARKGSPLILARGKNGMFLASDALAVLSHVDEVMYLEDGDVGEIFAGNVVLENSLGVRIARTWTKPDADAVSVERGAYRHYMRKEMDEQPRAVLATLAGAVAPGGDVVLPGLEAEQLVGVERLVFVACGSSYHACLVAARAFEADSSLVVNVELASEYRFRDARVDDKTLVIGVSQSGETADTLGALEESRRRGARVAGITNVRGSAITRACGGSAGSFVTRAGPELGVASTKAFLTQIVALRALSLLMARLRGEMPAERAREELRDLEAVAMSLARVLTLDARIRRIAEGLREARSMLYLGRGNMFPVALEGALKMTEISYIHAQGFAAGEMKHGPIALIERGTPVVVLAPKGVVQAKVVANLHEVKARGALVIAVVEEGDNEVARLAHEVIELSPGLTGVGTALATSVALQLLAYHAADLRGLNIDMPRNLAKSVTVE